ncbi:hypothetical protein RHMOL_Rhmol10G0182700 [Rhododendron molle]|uniref:Uncharacterized protein n=1 Tax=Rhododendron molle TaxID=49168 RepID=A0ACC0M4Q3_RHOML|nr:hypothetical protein RHMOL_Rhmol10G0182700 [Rhododendron molle]
MVNRRNGLGHETGESSNANPNLTPIIQAFVAALNANRRNQNYDNEPMNRTRAMNEFCKRRPPTFHGDTNPTVAETWLKEIKVILDTLGITQDGDRVALTTYQLKGEARYWWDLMEATHTVATMTFAEFETLFLDKYFPTPLRLAKEQEFMNLKQGTMTVTQYAAKFEELSRYAPNAVATEDKKARRFEWGLTTARKAVVAQDFTTYTSVVKCALRLESEEADFKTRWRKATGNTGGPIRTQHPNNNHRPYPSKSPQDNQLWETATLGRDKPQRGGRDLSTIQCYNCQAMGHYRHQCPQSQKKENGSLGPTDFGEQSGRDLATVKCYNCQAMGHYSRQCPQPQRKGNESFRLTNFGKQNPGRPSQQQNGQKQPMGNQQSTGGRIFALQTEEQEQDPSVIQGTPL